MMSRPSPNYRHSTRCRQAVFIDLDSFVTDEGRVAEGFDVIGLVGDLRDRGMLTVARAYADWVEFPELGQALGRAGFELMQVFPVKGAGGSTIPVAMGADAYSIAVSEVQIDSIVLVAEHVDFSGLARRIRERGLRAVGVGMTGDSSGILSAYDSFHTGGRLRDRFTRGGMTGRRNDTQRLDPSRKQCCDAVQSILARYREEGRQTISETQLVDEIRHVDASIELGDDITTFLRSLGRRVGFERREGELVIFTSPPQNHEEEDNGRLTTPEDYENLLARLQLRITPKDYRLPVVDRVFQSINDSVVEGRPITAQEVEDKLSEEFMRGNKEELREALRDTLRVLFVNRAFRLDNVDDGYHSPLTFNRLYIRTAEDLQLYYVEAILCAIKNRIRERGGGRPDLGILSELILGDGAKAEELSAIESQLQGADRPFKKPPRYTTRWGSTGASAEESDATHQHHS